MVSKRNRRTVISCAARHVKRKTEIETSSATDERKPMYRIVLIVVTTVVCSSYADVATFEDINLPVQSYWNGSDGSGAFSSGGISFSNSYISDWFYWDGFSYSDINDTLTAGVDGQYNSIAGTGQGGTSNYAICYIGFMGILPEVTLSSEGIVYGLYVTNNNFAYYDIAEKFGGDSGNDKDWFKLTITGKDKDGVQKGTVEFYLADYSFDDNNLDYIVDTWEYIDLTLLGKVKTLEFNLSSSDTGMFGMNTPGYFALDTILYQSQPPVAGPYTEAGINGYINPLEHGMHASPGDVLAVINPIFKEWATEIIDYHQAPGVDFRWRDPNKALGPATGDDMDIFSLGDLSREQVKTGEKQGWITLGFSKPFDDVNGYDFAVFENGFFSDSNTAAGSVKGELLAELAFVEVSSDGENFIRFPSVSLTEKPGELFSTIQPDKVHNLAGKHANAYNICIGTPFDLQELAFMPEVKSGLIDINDIKYIRIVDIPGTGDYYDEAVRFIDPNTDPNWAPYTNNHPIFDEWNTSLLPLYPSSGFDLEAVGILKEQQYSADIDLNGVVDIYDLVIFLSAWQTSFGQPGWNGRCDLAEPKDMRIDLSDFAVFASQWQEKEEWYIGSD